MYIGLDPEETRAVVDVVVRETLDNLDSNGLLASSDRLAYTEPEAAALLGIRSTALRDARLRGDLTATRLGGRIGYQRCELIAYLARGREKNISK